MQALQFRSKPKNSRYKMPLYMEMVKTRTYDLFNFQEDHPASTQALVQLQILEANKHLSQDPM